MDTIADWIHVNYEDLDEPRSLSGKSNAVQITFQLSPQDVPTAWRHHLDQNERRAVIEFKYLSMTEPTKTVRFENGIEFEIGRTSRRVYQIVLDLSPLNSGGNISKIEVGMGILAGNATEQMKQLGTVKDGNASAIINLFKPSFKFEHGFAH